MRLLSTFQRPAWIAAIKAGLVAGTVFILLQVGLGYLVHGESPWVKVRMIAAIALGPGVLAPPATFHLGIFVVAMLVHYGLSILYALVGAALLFRFWLFPATILGGLLGLLLYGINFYGFTALFPWFAEGRSWVAMLVHIVFGMIHGCGCKAMAPPINQSGSESEQEQAWPGTSCELPTVSSQHTPPPCRSVESTCHDHMS
jgi:hypothetical protein